MEEDLRYESGDVQENGLADALTIEGDENIKSSLLRRMGTPMGDLFYDPSYGNRIFNLLGEDITDDWLNQAKAAYRDCVNQDERVQCLNVETVVVMEKRRVLFQIHYRDLVNDVVDKIEQSLELR